jgi:hypothetical protein
MIKRDALEMINVDTSLPIGEEESLKKLDRTRNTKRLEREAEYKSSFGKYPDLADRFQLNRLESNRVGRRAFHRECAVYCPCSAGPALIDRSPPNRIPARSE